VSVTLTRQELYDRVWTEPVDTLAKEYGLSNVGLGKACRHDFPVPPRGYWARQAAGQRPPALAIAAGERRRRVGDPLGFGTD
jgi:hypothetical protein